MRFQYRSLSVAKTMFDMRSRGREEGGRYLKRGTDTRVLNLRFCTKLPPMEEMEGTNRYLPALVRRQWRVRSVLPIPRLFTVHQHDITVLTCIHARLG